MRNSDIFATDLSQLPGCTLSKHTIHTGDAPPQRQRTYQHSPAARREIERQTADMLANDIIEPSESVWQAPVVLIKKKTGDTRMCIDYRRLNSVTKQISFTLPIYKKLLIHVRKANQLFLH